MSRNREKSKNNDGSKKVLEGHMQYGKKFIPLILHILQSRGLLQETSYVHDTLPEIIWMGLINDALGSQEGSQLYIKLATTAKKIHESDIHKNFALCSSYSLLTKEECSKLVSDIGTETHKLLKKSLEPLIVLYEGFPLSFLGKNEKPEEKSVLINRIKHCVENHLDRFETTALATLAGITYIGMVTGITHYNYEIPDLNAVITNPDSEVTNEAAGFIRIGAMSAVTRRGKLYGHDWAISFWNQGLKIDPCAFEEIDNDQ